MHLRTLLAISVVLCCNAAIAGLKESGIRSVYAFGGGAQGPKNQFPQDIRRLRRQYFSSPDQLLTLAMATTTDAAAWAIAREVGAPITLHVNGAGSLVSMAQQMRSDCTYITMAFGSTPGAL